MPTWETQGAHRYYLQDDILHWETHGEITLADVKVTYAIIAQQNQTRGYSLAMYDASRGFSMGPDARRYIGEMNRATAMRGASAIFGAGVAVRTVMTLLHNVVRLFGRATPPLFYCSNAEEAQAWLVTQRDIVRPENFEPTV